MILATGLAIALVGALAIALGARGRRIDDRPRCRACRFDLSGAPADAELCPECGRSVAHPGAVRRGTYRRSRRWIGFGVTVALLGAFTAAAPAVSARLGIDWNRHLPTWWLTNRMLAPEWSARASHAAAEIEARLNAGQLSPARVRTIGTRILDRQADRSAQWIPEFGDLLLAAVARDPGLRDLRDRYIRQIAAPEVQHDPECFADRPLCFDLVVNHPRLGDEDSWWFTYEFKSITVNGVPVDLEHARGPASFHEGRTFKPQRTSITTRMSFSVWVDGLLGDVPVEVVWEVRAMPNEISHQWTIDLQRAADMGAKPEELMSDIGDRYVETSWTESWSGVLRVVPPDRARAPGMDDSLPIREVNAAIGRVWVSAARSPQGVSVWVNGEFLDPPIDLAYDVYLDFSSPARTEYVGRVGGLANETAGFHLSTTLEPLRASRVNVRFVPNADFASRRCFMMLIDSREIVRPNLIVDWTTE